MARMEPLPAKDWPPEMRDALAAMTPPVPRHSLTGDRRRQGANILGALAHHPALAKAFFTLNGHLLLATTLTARQRELVIMRVAVVTAVQLRMGPARVPGARRRFDRPRNRVDRLGTRRADVGRARRRSAARRRRTRRATALSQMRHGRR